MEDYLSETVKKDTTSKGRLLERETKRTAEEKGEEEKGLPKKEDTRYREEEVENKAGESKRGYQGAKTLLFLNSTTLQIYV